MYPYPIEYTIKVAGTFFPFISWARYPPGGCVETAPNVFYLVKALRMEQNIL